MATQIGIVTTLIGTATSTAADGSIHNLHTGDQVFSDDLISTGPQGAIEISFDNDTVVDLGRNSQTILDFNVFDPTAITKIQ
jgi:hypothetical protein